MEKNILNINIPKLTGEWLSSWTKDATSNGLSAGAFFGDQLIGALLCNCYGY
jgi:hypothetical protein